MFSCVRRGERVDSGFPIVSGLTSNESFPRRGAGVLMKNGSCSLRPSRHMKPLRNITRFTYEYTSFQGWRLTLCRDQQHYTRYFSDKQYGGEQQALDAALAAREHVLALLREFPGNPVHAFDLCRAEELETAYPKGLRPRKASSPECSEGE